MMNEKVLAVAIALALAIGASPVLAAKGASSAGTQTNQSGRSARCVDILANPAGFDRIAVDNCRF
jgi:hypothetical protein